MILGEGGLTCPVWAPFAFKREVDEEDDRLRRRGELGTLRMILGEGGLTCSFWAPFAFEPEVDEEDDRLRRRGELGTLRMILGFGDVCLPLQSLAPSLLIESEAEVVDPDPDPADWERRRGEFLTWRMIFGFGDRCLSLHSWAPFSAVCFSPPSLFLSSSRVLTKNSSNTSASFSVTSLRPFKSFLAVLVARKVL